MKKIKNLLNSLKNGLLGTNFALLAFISYVAKMLYFSPTFMDAPIFVAIAATFVYDKYLKSKKPDPVKLNTEVQAQINELQKAVRDAQMEKNINKVKRYF